MRELFTETRKHSSLPSEVELKGFPYTRSYAEVIRINEIRSKKALMAMEWRRTDSAVNREQVDNEC
jgi:hypothetical protein